MTKLKTAQSVKDVPPRSLVRFAMGTSLKEVVKSWLAETVYLTALA